MSFLKKNVKLLRLIFYITCFFIFVGIYYKVGDYMFEYIIIVLFLILIALVVIKANKPDFKYEANKLVEYLGGIKNIKNMEVSVSRFKVTLKDTSLVNKEGIQKLGAKGIVEIDNMVKIIFQEDSKKLKKYIEELKEK